MADLTQESDSKGVSSSASCEQAKALADTLNNALAYGVDPDVMEPLAKAASGLVGVQGKEGKVCILCAFHRHTHEFSFHTHNEDAEFGVHWGTDLEFFPLQV